MQLAWGGPNTGIPFHFHKDGYQELIFGRKLWSLYPPTTVAPGHNMHATHGEWMTAVMPNLTDSQQPVSCILHPGEVIYVPEGWNHAVLNLEDTLAAATQLSFASGDIFEAPAGWEAAEAAGEPEVARVMRKRTEADITWFQAFQASSKISEESGGDMAAAVREARRAVALNPTHSYPKFLLYKYLQSKSAAPEPAEEPIGRLIQEAMATHCEVGAPALQQACVKHIQDGKLQLFI
jgi:hypothetical protein